MKKLNVVNGSEIKKELPNANLRYIKLTKQEFEKFTSIRFVSDKIRFTVEGNSRYIELNLPELRNPKTANEPAFKELVDCITIWGFQKYTNYVEQGRFRAKAEKLELEEVDYQNEIQRLDNKVEELENEKEFLIQEVERLKKELYAIEQSV